MKVVRMAAAVVALGAGMLSLDVTPASAMSIKCAGNGDKGSLCHVLHDDGTSEIFWAP